MERLKSHGEFVTVLKRRRKVARNDIVVHFLVRGDSCSSAQRRLGLAVSKSVGNAVVRNAVKRRFRVLARQYEDQLPQCCDVVMRAKPSASSASFQSLDEQVRSAFGSIARKTSGAI